MTARAYLAGMVELVRWIRGELEPRRLLALGIGLAGMLSMAVFAARFFDGPPPPSTHAGAIGSMVGAAIWAYRDRREAGDPDPLQWAIAYGLASLVTVLAFWLVVIVIGPWVRAIPVLVPDLWALAATSTVAFVIGGVLWEREWRARVTLVITWLGLVLAFGSIPASLFGPGPIVGIGLLAAGVGLLVAGYRRGMADRRRARQPASVAVTGVSLAEPESGDRR